MTTTTITLLKKKQNLTHCKKEIKLVDKLCQNEAEKKI